MEVEEWVIILESSEWNTHKCYWEEDGTFALEKSSGFGRVSPAWKVSFVALMCCFQCTKTLSNVLEKEVSPLLEVIYGGDLK